MEEEIKFILKTLLLALIIDTLGVTFALSMLTTSPFWQTLRIVFTITITAESCILIILYAIEPF